MFWYQVNTKKALTILVERKLQIGIIMELMPDKETPRSIRFPDRLWSAIDSDAKRCKRSAVKQMEAVLALYYEIEDVEINTERLRDVKAVQLASINAEPAPRKKRNVK